VLIGLHLIALSPKAQEAEERYRRRPASAKEILAITGVFERAVNGNATVRNRCRVQHTETEIEETTEVIKRDGCKLVLKTRKVTRATDDQALGQPPDGPKKSSGEPPPLVGQKSDAQPEIEFTIYADLSQLTTPVLLEKQSFGQCEAGGAGVLRVSSRSAPGAALPVIRRSDKSGATGDGAAVKQTRRDLSLFFSARATAEKARRALERAVQSCGGKEWPDEDDLP
jgi:hypothetical protein